MNDREDPAALTRRLEALRREHRELDAAIARLTARDDLGEHDDLALKRMKKRKLLLKDGIARLESALIPDRPA